MNRHLMIALAIVASAVLAVSTVSVTMAATNGQSVAQSLGLGLKYRDYKDGVFKVMAGAGGATAPLTRFLPQTATIKVGESVMWFNPTRVGEPHNVAFALNQTQMADIDAPFIVNNSTAVTSLAPGNSQALTFTGPGGATVMVGANARAYSPTVIASDNTVMALPPNANYTMNGSEQYVNSGFIWPKGLSPPGLAPIDSFTVKFEKAGTYNYGCSIHPWMTGQVVVS